MYNLLCAWDFNSFIIWLLQTHINTKDSQIADLQENIKSQQEETYKAKEELKGALISMEQLKDGFKNERTNWETEKAALLKIGDLRFFGIYIGLQTIDDEAVKVPIT